MASNLNPPVSIALACVLGMAACGPDAPPAPAPAPVFSPQAFFTGRTAGEGMLDVMFLAPKAVSVTSTGHTEADGTLVLVQRIAMEGDPPRTRTWRLRPAGEGRFSGSLTDAEGPVSATVTGNRLHIAYRDSDGFDIEQWLWLRPDGTVADNRLSASRFGIGVAELREVIRKLD